MKNRTIKGHTWIVINALATAEDQIARCAREKTTSLGLCQLGLRQLPESVLDLEHMEELNLWRNHLATLPDGLHRCRRLQRLRLYENGPITLPESLANLPALEDLEIGGDAGITGLEVISRLRSLRALTIADASLGVVPEWLRAMKGLRRLDLASNGLTEIPGWLGELTELRKLSLFRNRLTNLPASFASLRHLEDLDLDENDFPAIPLPFTNCHGLKRWAFGRIPVSQFQRMFLKMGTLWKYSLTIVNAFQGHRHSRRMKHLEDFSKEAAKEKSRMSKGLLEAATAVAAMSGPIIATVEKLRPPWQQTAPSYARLAAAASA